MSDRGIVAALRVLPRFTLPTVSEGASSTNGRIACRENLPKIGNDQRLHTRAPRERRFWFATLVARNGEPTIAIDFTSTCDSHVRPHSLINTILTGSGKLAQGSELETVGIEVSDYNLALKSTKLDDLAGQMDYYDLHQLFMTERAVYVMTWDASKYLHRKEVKPHDPLEVPKRRGRV